MTSKEYRNLRNDLQKKACNVNIYSKEYKNLIKRITLLYEKTYCAIQKEIKNEL